VGRQYKTKKASIKERYKVAQNLHERLKRIIDDVSILDRQTERQADRETDRQRDRQIDKPAKKYCFCVNF
jgi:hypothetical protein